MLLTNRLQTLLTTEETPNNICRMVEGNSFLPQHPGQGHSAPGYVQQHSYTLPWEQLMFQLAHNVGFGKDSIDYSLWTCWIIESSSRWKDAMVELIEMEICYSRLGMKMIAMMAMMAMIVMIVKKGSLGSSGERWWYGGRLTAVNPVSGIMHSWWSCSIRGSQRSVENLRELLATNYSLVTMI